MPQFQNLHHLLFSSSVNASPLFLSPLHLRISYSFSHIFRRKIFPDPLTRKPPLLVTTSFSSQSRKSQKSTNPSPFRSARRNKGTLRETETKLGLAMEEATSGPGFNKKRAEGRDNNDRPKKILQLKERKLNPANTISYVQILGTGMDTQDTSPSVLLFFDKQRFIFNAGEGLQRFCTEHKIKLSKIDHIFLSRVCSETTGGLPGLLLTLAGIGEEGMSVNVWGPSDLKYLVDAMRSFIPNAAMVHTCSFGPAASPDVGAVPSPMKFDDPLVLINDEVVKISAVLLQPSGLESPECFSSHFANAKDGLQLKPGDLSVVYICELPEIKGKFDPKKAASLGLRPGPKYRELQLGNSVKSDRLDIMVHPTDVLGPSVPGPIVLLVDCPTVSHLLELQLMHSLSNYYSDSPGNSDENYKKVNCVIHLSPAFVTNRTEYQNWISRFSAAQHIIAGHERNNVEIPILKSSARIAARLNYLCPQFFPAPGFWSSKKPGLVLEPEESHESPLTKHCKSVSAENLLKFHLRPYAQLGIDKSGIPTHSSRAEIISELMTEIPEIADASQHVSQLWHAGQITNKDKVFGQDGITADESLLQEETIPCCLEDITREDLEIVLLGTGSSQPSKYRNVSSIFINLFSRGSLLLDCGEGTLGQLKRRFGVEGADDAVRGLRCIWISHIHADHHTGLARILSLRRDLLRGTPHEPVIVVGPAQLKRFLNAYQKLEDLDMQFLDCRHTSEASLEALESNDDYSTKGSPLVNQNTGAGIAAAMDIHVDSTLFAKGSRMQSYWRRPGSPVNDAVAIPILKSLKKELGEAGLEALVSFPVIHCPQAFGVALKAAERVNRVGKMIPGWKIVYSGDTRPCPELVKASIGASILIHEATFEDGLMEEAVARNHSTTKEAIEVGDAAGAYRIILTHFSQRYPKIPVFDETHMHKTCIAFDMMSVNLADLPVLPRVLPYLKLLFRNEMIVEEYDDVDVASATA